mgnify:CR=1 FL=1
MARAGVDCDCLNFCGDDPRLADGRVRPCERKVAHDAWLADCAARHQRTQHLRRELALADELAALEEVARLRARLTAYLEGAMT